MAPLIWKDGAFRSLRVPGDYRLLVIDSWRHRHGKSFGLGQHAARFNTSVAAVGAAFSEQQGRAIWQWINAHLSNPDNRSLELFPRISLL
ncbi:MAG: aminotransferase class IV, partial [Corynebacterium casei]